MSKKYDFKKGELISIKDDKGRINFIGKENKIGLKVNSNFYIHDFDQNNDNELLVTSILNMIKNTK